MQIYEMLNAINEKGMTQSEIAKSLKVNQSSVSRWLNGRNEMSHKTAKNIELLYKKTVANQVAIDPRS